MKGISFFTHFERCLSRGIELVEVLQSANYLIYRNNSSETSRLLAYQHHRFKEFEEKMGKYESNLVK